jgi:hypothetical protein
MFQAGDSFRCRFTTRATAQGAALEILAGPDILVQLKARPAEGAMALNSWLQGRWQREARIPLTQAELASPVTCHLAWTVGGLRLRVNEGEALAYPVAMERLPGATLRLPEEIEPLPPDGAPPPAPRGAEILAADIMHVRARLDLRDPCWPEPARRGEAVLALLLDGRPVRRSPLPPAGAEAPPWRPVQFDLDGEAFASDGMRVELALAWQGRRQVLARAVLRSEFIGGIEACGEEGVRGFVVNPRLPSRPVMVDVFLGGRFQGTARADQPRPDLEAFGPGYGAAGFEHRFAQPAWLPAGADMGVSVLVHNSEISLAGSPWPLCRPVSRTGVLAAMERLVVWQAP